MTKEQNKNLRAARSAYFILGIFLIVVLFTTYVLYTQTQGLFRWSIDEKLIAIASVASAEFNSEVLDQIKGPDSVGTKVYEDTVKKLQSIRNKSTNIRFIYILRKTENPDVLEFVADADSLHPDEEIDLNGDGTIDDSDALTHPGDEYPIEDYPEFKEAAFNEPFVDPELTVDQWGTFLSGTAPILAKDSADTRYVIGVDLEVSAFYRLTNLALVPFLLFVTFLLLVLTTQTVMLRGMWNKQVHLLNELDRQKDELISLVSHQLATPVSSIKWYLEMLQDGDLGALTKEQKEHVASMRGIGESMSDLVSMILDVSRIQLGRMRIEKLDLNLNDFFQELIATIGPKAIEKKVEFIHNIPKELPVAKLDRRYTNMTIENLLSNAVKYTPAGGKVTFDVTVKGRMLSVRVTDTGMGIPKADQAKIFSRMFRASNARNAVDGNGFGLFVAKGAVEAQGGKIWFKSEEGKGTTFFVDLPLE